MLKDKIKRYNNPKPSHIFSLFSLAYLFFGGIQAQAAIGGGTGGVSINFIQDEGSTVTQRNTLNFTGGGVTCIDNAGQLRTDCTVSGSGGGGTPALSISLGGVQISSPTGIINFSSRTFTVTQSPTGTANITSKVDTTTAIINYAYLFDGTNAVWAPQGTSYVFSVASFSDGLSSIQLIGSGVWKAAGGISFTASYNNGPPTSSTVTFSGWGTPLSMSSPFTSTTSVAAVNYPSVAGSVVFNLNSKKGTESGSSSITHTFYNYRYWGVSSVASGYTEANIEALAGSDIANSVSNTFTVSAGASQYIIYSYPTRLGTATFTVGGFEGGFQPPETVSITNSAGFTENYYAYRSTNLNLGNTTVVAN